MSKVVAFPAHRSGGSLFFSGEPPEALAAVSSDGALNGDAEGELLAIIARYPEALDARIALYKFYFRRGHYVEAERAAWGTLREAARQGRFTRNYRRLTPASADWEDHRAPARLYLFSLKALGVIRLRRGKTASARRVLTKLLELDPQDGVGGGTFLNIARQFES